MSDEFEIATRRVAGRLGAPGSRLVIVSDGGASTVPLPARGAVVLGRSSGADVRVDDESVSRRHARLELGDGVTVEDLGSANGTRVAGRALAPGERVALADGAVVELGAVLVVVHWDGGGAARATTVDEDLLLDRIARSQVNVLIVGETGSGKERMAERLHARSRRAAGPLVRINCAALAESLVEGELFGHEKGAFTGAAAARPGVIEAAHGGTLLLDEVGELPLGIQAKLLRALEQREVVRLGAVRPIAVDVRFLAATHRDLAALAAAGRFREDLYYRLDGITVRVPPLRDRRAEIPAIAGDLLADACRREGIAVVPPLSAAAIAALVAHRWPGNVRELRNVLDRALLRWSGGPIEPAHLDLGAAPAPPAPALRPEVDAFEKQRILDALERCGGNQTRAAKLLGISRRTMVARLQAWGMTRPRDRG